MTSRTPPVLPPHHGTASAHESAARLGLSTNDRDFRGAFISITSALLDEPSTAYYLGPTRDAERWAIVLCGRDIDVIYHPERAMISMVLPQRRSDGVIATLEPNGQGPQKAEAVL